MMVPLALIGLREGYANSWGISQWLLAIIADNVLLFTIFVHCISTKFSEQFT